MTITPQTRNPGCRAYVFGSEGTCDGIWSMALSLSLPVSGFGFRISGPHGGVRLLIKSQLDSRNGLQGLMWCNRRGLIPRTKIKTLQLKRGSAQGVPGDEEDEDGARTGPVLAGRGQLPPTPIAARTQSVPRKKQFKALLTAQCFAEMLGSTQRKTLHLKGFVTGSLQGFGNGSLKGSGTGRKRG